MTKLTDAELREPDITLIIPHEIWNNLAQDVKESLRFWIDQGDDTGHVFVVPAYRARELLAIQGIHQR